MGYGVSLTLQKNIVICCEPDKVESGQGEWRCCFQKQSESNTWRIARVEMLSVKIRTVI